MIYVDMDGVLVDFNKKIKEIFNKSFHELDNDWVWKQLSQYPNLYLDLDPMIDYWELWDAIKYYQPQILTAVPSKVDMPNVMNDKVEWISKHIGYCTKINFGPYSVDKQKWCKPGDVLIDDSYLNISQWNDKGGIGILHSTASDTIKQLKIKGIL